MKITTKILLTIAPVLSIAYLFTYIFPEEFHWLVPSMKAYYIQIGTLQVLGIIQWIFLLTKLWSFKNLERSIKIDWTWILILFSSIPSLIFIWGRVDKFEALNNKAKSDLEASEIVFE